MSHEKITLEGLHITFDNTALTSQKHFLSLDKLLFFYIVEEFEELTRVYLGL